MKIIIFAEENLSRNYVPYLRKKGTEARCISNLFQDMLMQDGQFPFDLAVVDGGNRDAVKAYHYFNTIWSIPVIFIVDSKSHDWDRIKSLQPVGFIPRKAGANEFYTRLMAVYRRFSTNNNPTKQQEDSRDINSFHKLHRYFSLITPQSTPLKNPVQLM